MEQSLPASGNVFIRLKRKRQDEPATHLVAEIAARGTKRMRDMVIAPGVFTHVGTVEDSAMFDDTKFMEDLNQRVNILTQASPVTTPAASEPSATKPAQADGPMSVSSTPAPVSPIASTSAPTRTFSPTKANAAPKTFTIVPKPAIFAKGAQSGRRPTAPPVVRSAAELAAAEAAVPATLPSYTFYEAIADEDATPSGETEDEDPAMAEFNSMVSDYLKLNNISLAEPKPSSRAVSPSLLSPTDEKKLPNDSSNEDYVYDVFYFALKDINDVNELMAREAGSIATLRGLPEEFTEYFVEEGSDDSVKDEADEDSNEEDYYRNDYPDSEDEIIDDEEDVDRGWRHWQYDD
ncbi:hypothetical protein FS837_000050 [Tulasnella sp. UAMH 9824]|nr:hypothetical protein FS837_000050 [Tulasnella sp. UAMH 9824]